MLLLRQADHAEAVTAAALVALLLALTNADRAPLPPLRLSAALDATAAQGLKGRPHDPPVPLPSWRVPWAGSNMVAAAGRPLDARMANALLLASPPHRFNILHSPSERQSARGCTEAAGIAVKSSPEGYAVAELFVVTCRR